MSQVRLRLFDRNEITGRDFGPFEEGEVRNLNTSPDGESLIRVMSHENNWVVLDNVCDVPFEFTVTSFTNNDLHVYAKCKYEPSTHSIKVNNNWIIDENGPTNQMVTDHDTNNVSSFFNIRFHSANFSNHSFGRLDVSIGDSETSSLFFTPAELLFITLEGDEAQKNLNGLTNHFIEKRIEFGH